MAIPLILGLFMIVFRPGIVFVLIYLCFIMLTALVLSLSRAGWIGFLLGLSLMAFGLLTSRHFRQKRPLMVAIGGSFALALIVLAGTPVAERVRSMMEKEEEDSVQSRIVACTSFQKSGFL